MFQDSSNSILRFFRNEKRIAKVNHEEENFMLKMVPEFFKRPKSSILSIEVD